MHDAEKAVAEKDFDELRRIGHKIKGSSAAISAKALAKRGARIEEDAKKHDIENIRSGFAALKDELYEKYFQAKSAALSYLSYGLKSSKEVKDYLAKKKYSTSIQEKVVEQFIKTGLIDDLYYAKAFTRDKLKLNHYGPIRIQMELKKKGIDEAFIDETLKEVSKEILIETAYEASIKKIHSLKNKSNFQKKQKIYQFLSYKGFDYDTIMSAWSKLQKNANV